MKKKSTNEYKKKMKFFEDRIKRAQPDGSFRSNIDFKKAYSWLWK